MKNTNVTLKFKKLYNTATEPTISSFDTGVGNAGVDLYSNARLRLVGGSHTLVGTGIAVEIPKGHVGILKARSGYAFHTGLTVNAGVIDENYRGEIKVLLENTYDGYVDIKLEDPIAQMLIIPVPNVQLKKVEELSSTDRAESGFNSKPAEK